MSSSTSSRRWVNVAVASPSRTVRQKRSSPSALQLPSLALELAQGDDLGQVGVQQPLLLALQLRDGLADGALAGVQLLRQPLPTTGPRQRRGNLGRISQQRGQVSPDQLVQLR